MFALPAAVPSRSHLELDDSGFLGLSLIDPMDAFNYLNRRESNK